MIIQTMRRFAANQLSDPGSWTPAALLTRLATEGNAFSDCNASVGSGTTPTPPREL
jgi:hypothetical protein